MLFCLVFIHCSVTQHNTNREKLVKRKDIILFLAHFTLKWKVLRYLTHSLPFVCVETESNILDADAMKLWLFNVRAGSFYQSPLQHSVQDRPLGRAHTRTTRTTFGFRDSLCEFSV